MSFWKSLERKVFRPVGRGLKAAAPVIGGVAGSFIPGVGNVVGSAIGSAIGGQVKKGKFDAGSLLKDAGVGVLTGGVMNKLGGGSFLGGAKAGMGASAAGPSAMNGMIPEAALSGAGGAAKTGFRAGLGNMLKDGKTIKALGDTAIGGYQAVQQERMMNEQRRQNELENQRIEEDRRRREAMDPVRGQLLAALMQRLGMGGQMGGGMA